MSVSRFARIEATDPGGGTERLEFHGLNNLSLSATVSSGELPTGFSALNDGLQYYNSLYWSKQAMAEAPGELSSAVLTHWLMASDMAY